MYLTDFENSMKYDSINPVFLTSYKVKKINCKCICILRLIYNLT